MKPLFLVALPSCPGNSHPLEITGSKGSIFYYYYQERKALISYKVSCLRPQRGSVALQAASAQPPLMPSALVINVCLSWAASHPGLFFTVFSETNSAVLKDCMYVAYMGTLGPTCSFYWLCNRHILSFHIGLLESLHLQLGKPHSHLLLY